MPGPQSLADLVKDPDFQAASPQVKTQAFEHVASQDPDWNGASEQTRNEVRTKLLGAQGPQGSAAGRFAGGYWGQINPIEAIKGLAHLVAHPVDTWNADAAARQEIKDRAADAFATGDTSRGVGNTIAGSIPLIGTQIGSTGEKIRQGDVAGGLGEAAGMITNIAAPELLKGVGPVQATPLKAVGERMYRGVLKPSTTLPAEEIGKAVRAGLRGGIPISPDGIERLSGLIDDLNKKTADVIAADPNRKISPARALQNADEVSQKFSRQVNPDADLAAIGASKNEFREPLLPPKQEPPPTLYDYKGDKIPPPPEPARVPRDLTAQEAQAMKQGTYAQLKSRSYGELKTAAVESQKGLARGLKEELGTQFPGVAAYNAENADNLALMPALERRVNQLANTPPTRLGHLGPLIAASVAGTLSGNHYIGMIAGVAKWVIDNPEIRTKAAIMISKGAGVPIDVARARFAGYVNALGQAADAGPSSPPDSK